MKSLLPKSVKTVRFAHNTIILVEALEEQVLKVRMEDSIAIVETWLTSKWLVNKTKAILVTKGRLYRTLN